MTDDRTDWDDVLRELRQINANLVLLHGVMQAISAQIEMALDDGEEERRDVLPMPTL